MKPLGKLLYSIGTNSYFTLVKAISPFNIRANKLCKGQVGLNQKIAENEAKFTEKSIWFHVSSLGEFEQGKPVMEALKKSYPQYRLVATFFSPSGYESKLNDSICDAVYYLPFESKTNADWLIETLKPAMAFWVKYDFWYYYLQALENKKIPVFLLAAQFRSNQIFFKPIGAFHQEMLHYFSFIFNQNQHSEDLLKTIGIKQQMVTGDNRYDRVIQITQSLGDIPYINEFKQQELTIVAGSSYVNEETFLAKALIGLNLKCKLIIAPHFVEDERIASIEKIFEGKCIRYSQLNTSTPLQNFQVLILDGMGLLARTYRYADAAFIGGGYWENGLHNSLEAAAFGMPLAFGPKINRFPEAKELVQTEIATIINQQTDFDNWITKVLNDENYRNSVSEKSRNFVNQNKGATEKVMNKIIEIVKS
ncbi:MAG: hypothetical protein K9I36_00810 [Bacteroidia bacterium]|nr:hypothetical protein [Bacteroidia bacterium]MCF8425243.1 hypothetical protein [Bacteroidia bacterium]